jgi:cysteine sulfinate desulfinase/cysteine desulfurase-like protein
MRLDELVDERHDYLLDAGLSLEEGEGLKDFCRILLKSEVQLPPRARSRGWVRMSHRCSMLPCSLLRRYPGGSVDGRARVGPMTRKGALSARASGRVTDQFLATSLPFGRTADKELTMTPVYLDNHATTPLDRRVLEAMLPFLGEKFGNAASRTHAFGWEAQQAVDEARAEVASLIGAAPQEIIFTSGATESDNLALKGTAEGYREKGRHIVTCATEHKAVLDSAMRLERNGFEVSYLSVDGRGRIDLEELRETIRDDTILVSLMAANNEIGTIHPIQAIGDIVQERGTLFHCDAAQAAGKLSLDVEAMHVDLMSVSAHKMYGPKGIGALYVRRRPRVRLTPLIDGGGHERGIRSGTLNVPGCVGFGKAAELAVTEMDSEAERIGGCDRER